MKQLKNFTPHEVVVKYYEFDAHFPSEGVARVDGVSKYIGDVAGVPVKVTEYGDVSGLPDPVEGVGLIVSRMVAAALPHRDDLFVPGGLVRDDEGKVVGCTHLEKV